METELTKRLKALCHTYKPVIPTAMRTIYWADEVPVSTGGIVDVVRFEDEYSSVEISCASKENCLWPERKINDCRSCIYARRQYGEVRPLVTCFEVKITMQDFHSGHGHNFYGHRNYFVVPKEIEQNVLNAVKQEHPAVGVLALHGRNLRLIRECQRQNVEEGALLYLMYAAFKKRMK